jgi:hypothetical protein
LCQRYTLPASCTAGGRAERSVADRMSPAACCVCVAFVLHAALCAPHFCMSLVRHCLSTAACCMLHIVLRVARRALLAVCCTLHHSRPSLCGAADARCAVRVAARGAALGRSGDAAAVCCLHLHGLVRVARRSVAPCGIEEHVRDRPFPATYGTVPGRAIKLNSEQRTTRAMPSAAPRARAPPALAICGGGGDRGHGPSRRWHWAGAAASRRGPALRVSSRLGNGPTAARAGRARQRPATQPGQRPAARLLPPARMLPACWLGHDQGSLLLA